MAVKRQQTDSKTFINIFAFDAIAMRVFVWFFDPKIVLNIPNQFVECFKSIVKMDRNAASEPWKIIFQTIVERDNAMRWIILNGIIRIQCCVMHNKTGPKLETQRWWAGLNEEQKASGHERQSGHNEEKRLMATWNICFATVMNSFFLFVRSLRNPMFAIDKTRVKRNQCQQKSHRIEFARFVTFSN